MLYLFPDYYPLFHCTADRCPDTCCAGWQIMIDPKSLKRYRSFKGPFRSRLRRSILWGKKCFRQDSSRRCRFLNQENLCDLYLHLGPEGLCRTCRRYPRHIEEFENVREISLSLSCPEAARLLLEHQEPLRFLTRERPAREESYEGFDPLLFSQLTAARMGMIRILQNRNLPLPLCFCLVTGLAHDLERRADRGQLFTFEGLLKRVERGEFCQKTLQKMKQSKTERFPWIRSFLVFLRSLELLRPEWYSWLVETQEILYEKGPDFYERREKEFMEWMKNDSLDWRIPFEQLGVYFLFSYFCGSVYDGNILACAQLAPAYVWLLRDMLMACWLRNEGTVSLEELEDLACRCSRELEHSSANQKRMEAFMAEHKLPF